MTKPDITKLLDAMREKAEENLESAKDEALAYTLTSDGAAQRKSITDHAVSETYSAIVNYIEAEFVGKEKP